MTMASDIEKYLGKEAEDLLSYRCVFPKDKLHLPGPDFIERVMLLSDRSPNVLRNLQSLFDHGRLAKTGYLSILPVDHGVEHSAGADFSSNPIYFDPEDILELAVEAGCNAVASTLGILGAIARKYAYRIPFIVKINHNQLLSYPNTYDQIQFASVDQAFDMGAVGVGATIYFGSAESNRQIQEISEAFRYAHELGLVTVLWAYLRNEAFRTKEKNYEEAADLTGQANYLGATIEADIVKQKQATTNRGFVNLKFGKTDEKVYSELTSDHPIDLVRYQVINCFLGRAGLINSGGASKGHDFADAARIAVINKRAGGMGVISGRKAFERPMKEGIELLNLVQDIYLDNTITVA
jgi:class I fructose-bisphosphate aldolase